MNLKQLLEAFRNIKTDIEVVRVTLHDSGDFIQYTMDQIFESKVLDTYSNLEILEVNSVESPFKTLEVRMKESKKTIIESNILDYTILEASKQLESVNNKQEQTIDMLDNIKNILKDSKCYEKWGLSLYCPNLTTEQSKSTLLDFSGVLDEDTEKVLFNFLRDLIDIQKKKADEIVENLKQGKLFD